VSGRANDLTGTNNGGASVAVDRNGMLYFAKFGGFIWRLSPDGAVTHFAGDGGLLASPQDGIATQTGLSAAAVATDRDGNVFAADFDQSRIWRITPGGYAEIIAGEAVLGFAGDGGEAVDARLHAPLAISLDPAGNVSFVDSRNGRIRRLSPAAISGRGVVNTASLLSGPVCAGELVTILGSHRGPAAPVQANVESGRLPVSLAGVQVFFDDVPAPLMSTAAGQTAAIVPYSVAGKTETRMQIAVDGQRTNFVRLGVAEASPGIFTVGAGRGQAAALNEDGTANSQSNPAPAGSILTVSVTGGGQTDPAGVDGLLAAEVLPKPLLPVQVRFERTFAEVIYAGAAPSQVAGIMTVQVRIPETIAPGPAVAIEVFVDQSRSQPGVTVAIQ